MSLLLRTLMLHGATKKLLRAIVQGRLVTEMTHEELHVKCHSATSEPFRAWSTLVRLLAEATACAVASGISAAPNFEGPQTTSETSLTPHLPSQKHLHRADIPSPAQGPSGLAVQA